MSFNIYRQVSKTGFVEPEAVEVLNGRWLIFWTIIEPDEIIETRMTGP